MKAYVCFNKAKKNAAETMPIVLEKLREYEIEYVTEKITEDCDVIITVGGDGTILSGGKLAAEMGKPLLGINTGRLGFMATLECHELDKLQKLKERNYSVSKRMLLSAELSGVRYTALNDVVFMKDAGGKLPDFRVSNHSAEVLKIRADGIIFSTPTGSTAYALSAGGPIIEPDADCIEFTPLCAHSLFGRTVIFSAESVITVKFDGCDGKNVFVSADGEQSVAFSENNEMVIKKSDKFLNLIDIDGNGFYNAVHNKLMRPLK